MNATESKIGIVISKLNDAVIESLTVEYADLPLNEIKRLVSARNLIDKAEKELKLLQASFNRTKALK